MSTHTPSTERPTTACSPALIEFAAQQTIDPRIPAAVPDFDAPFFQAGLAGYSDAAMRLIARRHGSPWKRVLRATINTTTPCYYHV